MSDEKLEIQITAFQSGPTDNVDQDLTVYFLTVMRLHEPPKDELRVIQRKRCWGFFKHFAEAEEIVLKDITSIYEDGYYDFAVIEQAGPGICVGMGEEYETWYRAAFGEKPDSGWRELKSVTKIQKPEGLKRTVRFWPG